MGLGIESGSVTKVSGIDPVGSTQYTAPTEQVVGLGPSGRIASRGRPLTSTVFGFFTAAVAAVILSAGLGSTAHAQVKAPAQTEVTQEPTSLRSAFARLVAADQNGDQKWIGGRYGNELQGLDPAAKAIFDYVNYVNPAGQTSLWGPASAGDYSEGGGGVGYSFRPKHMTRHQLLLKADLDVGLARLERQMSAPLGDDQVTRDIEAVLGKLPEGPQPERLAQIHAGAERLLDLIVQATNKKEIATRSEVTLLTDAELLAALPAGSIEHAIAEAAIGHGPQFFQQNLEEIDANRVYWRLPPRVEVGVIGEAQQHYLLVIAKRAMEAKLIADIQAAL